MNKINLALIDLPLDLKVNWKISRNQTLIKNNFIIRLFHKNNSYDGEIAFNIRYNETYENTVSQFYTCLDKFDTNFLNNLKILFKLNINHSLKCAFEQVFLKAYCFENHISIKNFLNIKNSVQGPIVTSYSIPIMEINKLENYILNSKRFYYLKLKIDGETYKESIAQTLKHMDNHQQLIIDANEAFNDPSILINYSKNLKNSPILLFEQPFPSHLVKEQIELKNHFSFPLMADESIEDSGDFTLLKKQFDIINIKIMKTGGLIQAKNLIESAQENQLKVFIGCMIESSLSISYALNLRSYANLFDLDGCLLIKEDPYRKIIEENGKLFLN